MDSEKISLHNFRPKTKNNKLPFDLMRFDRIPDIAFMPQPNRHTFYEVFWVTEGSGTHIIDFIEYEIRPNTLFFVGRGLVHYWNIRERLNGVVLLFKADLFHILGDDNFLTSLEIFQANSQHGALYLEAEEAAWVDETLEQIEGEFTNQFFSRSQMITAMLQMLLIRVQRLAMSQQTLTADGSAKVNLTRRYLQLIDQDAKKYHKVSHYADLMGVTIGHLSSSVKEVMGLTAGDLLRQQIILEAKRQLVHTNLTVAEIAFELNLVDPSYFGRFFKREAGETPKAFRSRFITKYQKAQTN